MSDEWVAFDDENDETEVVYADESARPEGDVPEDDAEDAAAAIEAALAAARLEFGDIDVELGELMRPGGEHSGLPVLAVVGRPNVGKSTLVNRMIGRREAVTEDVPGVTRDRVTYEAEWNGVRFILIDTGGWDRKVKGMAAQIAAQAERAINDADATLFIVDAKVGATDTDEAVVQVLRKSGKPVHARRQQGGRRQHRARGAVAVVARSGRAALRLRPARPWRRRPARRRRRHAARGGLGHVPRRAARVASPCWASPTSASPRCSTPSPAASASSSTASPARPSTRSTS